MIRRNLVHWCVVELAIVEKVERVVARAARRRLTPPLDPQRASRNLLGIDVVFNLLTLDRLAVEVEMATDHLDSVARQADHALNQVRRLIVRMAKHRDIAALGARDDEDAAGEQVEGER